jgi:hypothetical protein
MQSKRAVFVSIVSLLGLLLALPASAADLECLRQLPDYYQTSGDFIVTLRIDMPGEKPNGLIIKEMVPGGWKVIRATPRFDRFDPISGEIKWLLMGRLDNEMTISYTLAVPVDSKGDQVFSGNLLYTGADKAHHKQPVAGDNKIRPE